MAQSEALTDALASACNQVCGLLLVVCCLLRVVEHLHDLLAQVQILLLRDNSGSNTRVVASAVVAAVAASVSAVAPES